MSVSLVSALVSQLVLVYVSVFVSAVCEFSPCGGICVCIREWRVLAFFRFCVLDFPLKYLVLLVSRYTS